MILGVIDDALVGRLTEGDSVSAFLFASSVSSEFTVVVRDFRNVPFPGDSNGVWLPRASDIGNDSGDGNLRCGRNASVCRQIDGSGSGNLVIDQQ